MSTTYILTVKYFKREPANTWKLEPGIFIMEVEQAEQNALAKKLFHSLNNANMCCQLTGQKKF